jgi:hypothetical protein
LLPRSGLPAASRKADSISKRIAAERVRSLSTAHWSKSRRISSDRRTPMIGACRVAGRPPLTFIDFAILSHDQKDEPRGGLPLGLPSPPRQRCFGSLSADHLAPRAGLLLAFFARLGLAFTAAARLDFPLPAAHTIIAQLTWTLTLTYVPPTQFAYVTLQFIEADQLSRRQAWFKAVLSKHG